MTPQELAELRKLCEAATPGPWKIEQIVGCGNENDIAHRVFSPYEVDRNNGTICDDTVFYPRQVEFKNQAFIAASREALPELLDEVGRLSTHKKLLFEENGRLLTEKESGQWDVNCKENQILRQLLLEALLFLKTSPLRLAANTLVKRINEALGDKK